MAIVTIPKKNISKKIRLDRYAGKWVAFIDDKIVAWANTLDELDKKIKKLRFSEEAVYFLVPRKDEGPYILVISHEERI